jgi:hypothetical protein
MAWLSALVGSFIIRPFWCSNELAPTRLLPFANADTFSERDADSCACKD